MVLVFYNKLYIIQSLITKRIVLFGEIMKTRKIPSIIQKYILTFCVFLTVINSKITDRFKIQGELTLLKCTLNNITSDLDSLRNSFKGRS